SKKKTVASSFLAAASAAFFLFLFSFPSKSHYHSLFLSQTPFHRRNDSISDHLYVLTRRPHIAGSEANAEAAAYVLSALASFGIRSHVAPYFSALTLPISRSLILIRPPPDSAAEFALRQESYPGDPYADVAAEAQPAFHGFAKSGTAVGPVVYANYGRVEDYAVLAELGINLTGSVALARYGKIYRGDIVRNAQDAGAIGVVIYTDRKDYGGGGDAKWFPDDRWMPPSGVQAGSVYTGVGDPTTPGWPSVADCERLSESEAEKSDDLVSIPSLPISWADGEVILRSLGGEKARDDWQGGVDAPVYRIGPGPGIVNLTYQGQQLITRIENVVGIIEGEEEPDRYVILGNHRDAWTFGAVDPNSGTACLLEVAEGLQRLRSKGWKPRRTIIICNWDAEEYGLIGSTEWVEENLQVLISRAVVYLNVDISVAGPVFQASATPQLDELLREVAKQVSDPDNSSRTLYDSWAVSSNAHIGRLGGGGSDYAAFVQHAGVASVDVTFDGDYPVYHSMYDDFVWMKKFGDPGFHRHVAVANFWGLTALRLADDVILPFNYVTYARELLSSTEKLKTELAGREINLDPLFDSIDQLERAAVRINGEAGELKSERWLTKRRASRARDVNDRLMVAERAFADRDGLRARPWRKHLV
ncbi:hypothetical protein M569_15905, partial [Genlisea aurea]